MTKKDYYLDIAKAVLGRGTCNRRNYGAVIVNDDEIVSTGYTGNPRGSKNCIEIGMCYRVENNVPSGEQYEKCKSVHAEQNAIIQARRKDMIGSTLYLYGYDMEKAEVINDPLPCNICERMIINAGIQYVVNDIAKYRVTSEGLLMINPNDDNKIFEQHILDCDIFQEENGNFVYKKDEDSEPIQVVFHKSLGFGPLPPKGNSTHKIVDNDG